MEDVTILITSFLRPGYLAKTLAGIETNLSDCQVIVVDDSDTLPVVETPCCQLLWLPFDTGLSEKRNQGVAACETKYLLLGSDDFDFSTAEARSGIQKLTLTLDENPDIDIAGGRVDNRPYEGTLEYIPGEYIKEHRLYAAPTAKFFPVDLTVNYFLGRTEVMRQFPWPPEMRIGGEHVCLFLDLKQAGRKVVWVPSVNINTLRLGPEAQDPRYDGFRRRAVTLGHPLMKRRYQIKDYYGFAGDKS